MCKQGDTVTLQIDGKPVGVDFCIAPLVRALNDAAGRTVASCCGHGRQPVRIDFADGTVFLLLLTDHDTANRIGQCFPPISPRDGSGFAPFSRIVPRPIARLLHWMAV